MPNSELGFEKVVSETHLLHEKHNPLMFPTVSFEIFEMIG